MHINVRKNKKITFPFLFVCCSFLKLISLCYFVFKYDYSFQLIKSTNKQIVLSDVY